MLLADPTYLARNGLLGLGFLSCPVPMQNPVAGETGKRSNARHERWLSSCHLSRTNFPFHDIILTTECPESHRPKPESSKSFFICQRHNLKVHMHMSVARDNVLLMGEEKKKRAVWEETVVADYAVEASRHNHTPLLRHLDDGLSCRRTRVSELSNE